MPSAFLEMRTGAVLLQSFPKLVFHYHLYIQTYGDTPFCVYDPVLFAQWLLWPYFSGH